MKHSEKPELAERDPYGCDDPTSLESKSCSATDCTGLIPSLPQSDEELESYAEIYHYSGDVLEK